MSHNLVADDECILAFDINTTKTGLINYEDDHEIIMDVQLQKSTAE